MRRLGEKRFQTLAITVLSFAVGFDGYSRKLVWAVRVPVPRSLQRVVDPENYSPVVTSGRDNARPLYAPDFRWFWLVNRKIKQQGRVNYGRVEDYGSTRYYELRRDTHLVWEQWKILTSGFLVDRAKSPNFTLKTNLAQIPPRPFAGMRCFLIWSPLPRVKERSPGSRTQVFAKPRELVVHAGESGAGSLIRRYSSGDDLGRLFAGVHLLIL